MQFTIRCQCGQEIAVEAAQAGTEVPCACGQLCAVPSLRELQGYAAAGTVADAVDVLSSQFSTDQVLTPQPCQVNLLSPPTELPQRINHEAFQHFLQAMVREVEEFFEKLPEGPGVDCRMALALLPEGNRLVDVAIRPDCVELDGLRQQLVDLPAPPVRRGPVAILAHMLVRGGSADLANSFRHLHGPYYRSEQPEWFQAALAKAERAATAGDSSDGAETSGGSAPKSKPAPWWDRAKAVAGKVLARVRRFLSPEALPAQPPPAPRTPSDAADAVYEQIPRFGVAWAVDELTKLIEQNPGEAALYGRRGDLLQGQEQYEQALADYTRLIELAPRNARAFLVRGTCHRNSGSMERALADFNEALWLQPGCAEALAERSRIYLELQAVDHALADVSAAIGLEPYHPRWPMLRGRILAMQDMLDQAVEDFTLTLRLDPHHEEAYFLRGHAHRDRRARGSQAEADNRAVIADFTAVLRYNADFAWAYAYRAEARLFDGDLPGAMSDCEDALRRDEKCALAFAIRGAGRQQQSQSRAAIDDCTQAIQLGADGVPLRLARAEALGAEGEWEPALEDCNSALEDAPNHAGAYALRARIHVQLGSLDEAMEDAEAAIRVAPEWHVGYTIRGNLHGLRGEHDEALSDLSEALRLEPKDFLARQNRGVAWCYQDEFDKAIADFNKCIEEGADEAHVYFGRANAWLRKGEPQKARADFDEVLRLDAEFAPAYFSRANLLAQLGEHKAAHRDFDALIERCPTLAIAYAGRANLWLQMGEPQKAEEDFQEAIRLDPGSAEGYALQRLIVEASFHYRKEDYSRTIALATEAIEMEPDCLPAYSIRAAAWWCSEHQVEAADDFSKLLELGDELFSPYCNRGQILAEMGEFDRALEDLNKAMELGKTESPATLSHVLSGRGLAYAGLGRYQEANSDFDQCLRDAPQNAWVHYYMGLMHHGRGDMQSAADCFRQALGADDPALPPRKRDRAKAYLRRMEESQSVSSGK